MTVISDYETFEGRHPETGSVRNVLGYHGVMAPHTGQPLSEDLLLALSGGLAFGYFVFEYAGFPPLLSLLSRNTFDPLETLLARLRVPRDVRQTTSRDRAEATLLATLESGEPAIVWADTYLLPYTGMEPSDEWWAMQPLVVYGMDDDIAWIADRSKRPLRLARGQLAGARARVAKERFRQMTLGIPELDRLPEAVEAGLRQATALFLDRPPKGAPTNFGLAGLRHWAAMLTNTRHPRGWARVFGSGPALWCALAGAGMSPGLAGWVGAFGDGMDRGAFARALDEAAELTGKAALRGVADSFRESRLAWLQLLEVAMPDAIPALAEARRLVLRRREAFVERGMDALGELRAIDERRRDLAAEAAASPLADGDVAAIRSRMRDLVTEIASLEGDAFLTLRRLLD